MDYLHRDHLGSIDAITDGNGITIRDLSFDPYGDRRAADWSQDIDTNVLANYQDDLDETTIRGYTGHEHLDRTGIIHMNGRIYDATLGRFLQPDPIVSRPDTAQGWNRYAYVSNSPLSATDPSGYEVDDYPIVVLDGVGGWTPGLFGYQISFDIGAGDVRQGVGIGGGPSSSEFFESSGAVTIAQVDARRSLRNRASVTQRQFEKSLSEAGDWLSIYAGSADRVFVGSDGENFEREVWNAPSEQFDWLAWIGYGKAATQIAAIRNIGSVGPTIRQITKDQIKGAVATKLDLLSLTTGTQTGSAEIMWELRNYTIDRRLYGD